MSSLLLFAIAASLSFEPPEFGVRADWPLTPSFSVDNTQPKPGDCGTPQCIIGESAGRKATFAFSSRFPLHPRLALRLTPGWQRISFDYSSFDSSSTYGLSTTGNRWELPVAVEWLLARHVRPALGGVMSVVSGEQTWYRLIVAPGFGSRDGYTNMSTLGQTATQSIGGAVADLELPFRHGGFIVAPNVRYTRWFSKHFGRRGQLDSLTVGISLRVGKF